MCGGLEYEYVVPETGGRKTRKVYFPVPKAKLPVMRAHADGHAVEFVQWGRRHGEDAEKDVPVTGWARLLSLKEGKWNRYHPRRVKIPALRWMEKDGQKRSHWFNMPPGQCILGIEIEAECEKYVYVVTRPAQGAFAEVHDRMPLLISVDSGVLRPEPLTSVGCVGVADEVKIFPAVPDPGGQIVPA